MTSGSNSYSLAYDALGRCVKRTRTGTTTYYIYDGERPILEYKVNPIQIVARNVYGKGVDEILMRTATGINGNQPFYYQQDHEGSVTHLTNASGTVIEKYRYDIFGNPVTIYSAGTYNNRFKFTGREFNSTFGFYEYRARAYHPILGRFMSEDPKLFDPGDYNLFRYCHNDPIDFSDPMGLSGETTGLLQSGTHDRVWDMTKWFDSSNLIQGNFRGFAAKFDRDAKGLTMGQVDSKADHGVALRARYRQMNEEKLAGLDPRFAPMARRFVDAANAEVNLEGLEVRISHGTRSHAEQAELYRKGLWLTGNMWPRRPEGARTIMEWP